MTYETVRHINGRPWSRLQIGWLTLTESTDYQQYGEYAADYWTATAQPGQYPLYAFKDCGQRWHSLGVSIPGTIKSGSWWNKRKPGEAIPIEIDLYPHALAKLFICGDVGKISLLPGVEAKRIDFEYDGEQKHTYGIFAEGEQV